ncbi:alpha/beta hydrolase [Paludicola sp. MB14-C6]|uniref:alpha/beta hydrolase n=1 Tax=Paludihabitans sp. MB14-C6 TaxID=3070656 RepID=UPI0027DE1FFC|nr:alpha/beta hydrolase [Paludicola sp. MB14-C6]WMJ21918.1 alpha/beta hydrolase [Paludicola sp. MB14-C6]
MSISKLMLAALKALSYPDIDVKNNYKFERQVINATHVHLLKPLYHTWDETISTDDYDIPVKLFSPNEERDHPVLLFFHGGGWVTGNVDSYHKVCANMAKLTKHIVASVDYRLAPEYKFPIGLNDCYAVAKAVMINRRFLTTPQNKLILAGDSAGGNLAAAVSLMARDKGEFTVAKQILLYPSTYHDHTDSSPFDSVRQNGTDFLLTSKKISDYMELYESSSEDRTNPYFAPLLADNLKNQPQTLIITAQFDPLRDEAEEYGRKLKQAGNYVKIYRIKDALHGFFSLSPSVIQVKHTYKLINEFLKGED